MVQANVFDIEDGSRYIFDESKLSSNLHKLSFGLEKRYMDIDYAIRKIQSGISDRLTKDEFVVYVGESLNELVTKHPDFSILAARVEVQHLHEKLGGMKFTENLRFLRCINANSRRAIPNSVKRARKDQLADESSGSIISGKFYQLAMKHREIIDNAIRPERDYDFSYFGWKTLCKSYLLKSDLGTVHETPQFLLMRTALAIHGPFGDVDRVIETYNLMSEKYFIHASPTLFNSGTANQYLSSCFLLGINEDSIDGIYKTLHKTAMISKASGGIGIHVSNIRACGSSISSSRGRSSGIVPMLRVFNNTARYVDQGGNKRPGAFCIYLEPWHSDIFDFLQLRKNHGKEEMRARDLFYGLWIPDLFMRRVKSNDDWSLFSPDDAPGLSDCYGEEFEKLYEKYELEVKPMRTVKAQQLWKEILLSQIETGGPFMLYKDSCNKKSNQKNLGTIKSSNLCCEIIEYSSPTEVAVCNLASVALPRFVKTEASKTWFDYKMLHNVVKVITRNLDHIIDICDYPVPEAEYSNKKNRPLAIGVQGFADMLMMLRLPFESDETTRLNKVIFETIYHAALETSIELAEEYGPYGSFKGSPASEGLLQFDLWGLKEDNYSFYYKDWEKLKQKLSSGPGMRNSLLVAPMPTASTSQILGFTESFEPMTSMIYTRRVLSGEYTLVNKYMVQMFCDLDIWDEKLKNTIIANNGSIQEIEGIPQQLKNLFKTVWEVSQKRLVDLSSERAPFIDQSQSLNLFLDTPTMGKLTSMHFYAWEKGLKTGMYYLRTKAASSAIKFTINTDNTLTTPVQVPDLAALESVEYVEKTPFDDKDQSTSPSARATPFSILLDRNKSKDDEFGIHDSTPLSCSLIEGSTCDSCSG